MEEVCSYNKYGYCRFGENCQKSIIVKCANIKRHANQQKLVQKDTLRTVKNTTQKKVAGLEVTVRILTKETRIQVNPVSAKLR